MRLAQAILKLLSEATPEGAVFRIDLRLRPEGAQGDLAISLATALEYYRTRGREWEFQMLIKARVCAGEPSTGEEFLREMHRIGLSSGWASWLAISRPARAARFRAGIVQAVAIARTEISLQAARSVRRME